MSAFQTMRNCLGIFAIFAIFAALTADAGQGQVLKKCAEFNEYCQNHWDCCSNSCMSYLYRCSRNYPIFPYLFFGSDYPEVGTLDDILEQNFGSGFRTSNSVQQGRQVPMGFHSRFGDFEGENNVESQQQNQPKVEREGKQILTIATTITAAAAEPATTSDKSEQPTLQQRVAAADAEPQAETTTAAGQVVSSNATTVNPDASAAAQCKEIGEKCYTHDECCSQRCHGFLHQCVT